MNRIDEVLQRAADAGEVPGVVAMAADKDGTIYEGAFGKRSLAEAAPMTVDTVFRIMSMTKAVTSTAAMMLVEQGAIGLDQPVAEITPAFGKLQVLEGYDGDTPRLRPPTRQATVRQLLTHTTGLTYEIWNANTLQHQAATGTPSIITANKAALGIPLASDPGTRWEYGINIDWLAQVVEAASGRRLRDYFREQIFAPLGMDDTSYRPTAEHDNRLATIHMRGADGSLAPMPYEDPPEPEIDTGGHGLLSTAGDYIRFLRMFLNEGALDGAQVLKPETVRQMLQNHIGDLDVTLMKTCLAPFSNDAEFFPGMQKKHGLGFMINMPQAPGMRAAGSAAWAGLFNTYYWFDPANDVAGVILMQILPFADEKALVLFAAFEQAVYASAQRAVG
jgi:CubicO group peptidase (beta-lactamase class C family)